MQRFCAVKSVEATTLHGNEYILAGMKLCLGQALCARLYETNVLSFHNYVWQMLYINNRIRKMNSQLECYFSIILTTASFFRHYHHIDIGKEELQELFDDIQKKSFLV